jgi:hypothetical protein
MGGKRTGSFLAQDRERLPFISLAIFALFSTHSGHASVPVAE